MSERRRRLAASLAQVIGRLEACQARTPTARLDAGVALEPSLAEARASGAALNGRDRLSTSDQIEAAFDVVARGERITDRACGSPEPFDRALLLIAKRHGLEDQ
jgi:hypothetical protein